MLRKTVTLTFDPDSDESTFLQCFHGQSIALAVSEFDQALRQRVKYEDKKTIGIDEARDLLREKLSEYDVLETVLK